MDEYRKEKIFIGNKPINILIDKNEVKWYPLRFFLRKILFKKDIVERYRESYVKKHMKPIVFYTEGNGGNRNIKTWFINEMGVKYILRNMKVVFKNNRLTYNMQKKALIEACMYFKINSDDKLKPKFINQMPILDEYDIWSKVCIESDILIPHNVKWMLCESCGYYYPVTGTYFSNGKCKQCDGKDFKSRNEIIQYIKDKGGIDLLYALDTNKEDNIIKELEKFINNGGKNGN